MARRVRFFSSQIEKEKEPINVRPLYEQDMGSLITVGPRGPLAIDELDTKLAAHEARLLQMNESYETLSERSRELIEARHVLRETAVFFQQVCVVLNLSRIAVTNIFFQAEGHHSEIRTSFDDSAAPLLQHDDTENQLASQFLSGGLQFDLE